MADSSSVEQAFRTSERNLWRLCYRMTGVAADADELVQEAFVRALEAPAGLGGTDLERWLVRVATNLSLDRLRRRKRQRYEGPWLPSPVETPERTGEAAPDTADRYQRAEEVSYAFLVALELLTPKARAAVILADVLEYPACDIARVLDTSEGNVRVLHHRARRVLDHPGAKAFPTPEMRARQNDALQKFVLCMMQQDAAGLEALLAEDVRSITDGGGRYTALREPLVGRERVIRFHLETARRRAPISTSTLRDVNGVLALVVETRPLRPQMAPRLVLRCEVDDSGRIVELHTILAPQKLGAVRFLSEAPL